MTMATAETATRTVIATSEPPASIVAGKEDRDGIDESFSDSIGLTISVSVDQHDDDDVKIPNSASMEDAGSRASFIPSSVGPSPIPFEFDDDDAVDDDGGGTKNSTSDSNPTLNGSPGLSSIMRQHEQQTRQSHAPFTEVEESTTYPSQTTTIRQNGGVPNDSIGTDHNNRDHSVAALEDRVRDLEEKLSTLSMLLAMKPQSPNHQDRQFRRSSPPHQHHSSPLSLPHSIDESSSSSAEEASSPPQTFRSLASFSTIPTSNHVPVLESPTPVSRRYHRGRASFGKSSPKRAAAFTYEAPPHSEPHMRTRSKPKINRNLSYRILHAPDSELDLRTLATGNHINHDDNDDDGTGNGSDRLSDTGREPLSNLANQTDNTTAASGESTDDSFEKTFRVPTLDSLPGSSRTSPILSNDPHLNRVLSSDSVKNIKSVKDSQDDHDTTETGAHALPSPASRASGKSPSNCTNHHCNDGGSTHATPPGTIRKRSSHDGSHSKNHNNINDDASTHGATNESGAGVKHPKKKSNIKSKWLDYLNSVKDTNYDTDKQMEEFVRVPSAVEALLFLGFWISVDSFLYTLTMLPLRFVYSLCLLVIWVYKHLVGRGGSGAFTFHRHNSYHLIQATIIYTICAYVLVPIDVSVLYHWIRSQSMVKLYLLVAIVEVFDRLMCSLGQDCLDSLYWNTTRRPRSSRLIISALVVLVYTGLHSFLLFVHVATLNVAMNSNDQALLSLLIGGNFAEIKSTVFKKYNKATLFKIAASDICERFKLFLFLILVLTLNASQGMDKTMLYNYMSMCWIVICAEWLSDWLKHAFITKFNYIASGVYAEYGLLLAGDVSGFGHEGENLDVSHAVVKRLGMAQIPLVCVMAKYLKEAYKYQTYENQPPTWVLVAGFISVWLFLLVTKFVLGSLLQRKCRNKLEAAPEFSKTNTAVAKKKN